MRVPYASSKMVAVILPYPPHSISFPTGLFILQVAFYYAGKSVFKRLVGLGSIPNRGFERSLFNYTIFPTLIFIEDFMLKYNGALTIFGPLCIPVTSDSTDLFVLVSEHIHPQDQKFPISLAVKAFTCWISILSLYVSMTL
jgi:hypothetical protein